MTSYYIYYRLRPDAGFADALRVLQAMQATLARRTGIVGRIMRRADDPVTWMEIYEGVSDKDGFDAALQDEADAHRAADLLEPGTTRHLERFVPCA
ncbi:DUF4936 family protein [Thauera sinica]|uniref:DUF4936 family protein n=1 Tax=Thauera sinica TaxID=2665146 RepID=A0ABW1AWN4_9RHOO|nr:DUF4936 family protein [Thauera sp. K11]